MMIYGNGREKISITLAGEVWKNKDGVPLFNNSVQVIPDSENYKSPMFLEVFVEITIYTLTFTIVVSIVLMNISKGTSVF